MAANFEYYKVFFYVSQYSNITRAAEVLRLTQPSITKSIQNLEIQLGCRLFERSKRGVTLTPEGQMLYQRIQSACRTIFEAEEELERMKSMESGVVRICTGVTALKSVLMSAIQTFHQKYPNIDIEIQDKVSDSRITGMERGEFDIILDMAPVDTLPDLTLGSLGKDHSSAHPDVNVVFLESFFEVPMVGKELFHLAQQELTLKDLLKYPLILRKIDASPRGFYNTIMGDRLRTDTTCFAVNSLIMRIFLTQASMGISFMPEECVREEIAAGTMLPLRVPEHLLERRLIIMTPKNRQLSFAAQTFLEIVTETVQERRTKRSENLNTSYLGPCC